VLSSSIWEFFAIQPQLATEIRRVAHAYFLATPWKGFPIEPHHKLPPYQFVPKDVQRWLIQRLDVGWREKGYRENTHLLWQRQIPRLFPDACIVKQRVIVWPESSMANSRR
jgi:hypothetical protein